MSSMTRYIQLDAPCRKHRSRAVPSGIHLENISRREAQLTKGKYRRPRSSTRVKTPRTQRRTEGDTCQTVNGQALTTVKRRALALGSRARERMER